MKKQLTIAMGLALAGISSITAAEGLEFSANVAMTSNYVYRGWSNSDNEVALQGGFDMSHSSGVYAGVWASSVDAGFTNGADVEVDTYLGWGGDVGPVGVDVGWLRYNYPSQTGATDIDTDEFHVGVSKDLGPVAASLTFYYSDDFFALDEATYWDLGLEAPVGAFTVAAHYGTTDYDNDALGTDYDDWSLGVSTEFGGFGFDLTYTDTDDNTGSNLADDKVAFTISKSL